jgi:two-component system, OmpR family, phosphate regulon sensor histidine kinase PhoR
MQKKLDISRIWMIGTLLLIILFQGYWLRKTYQESYLSLRREIGVVLREALVRDQMQSLFGDSANSFILKDTISIGSGRVGMVQLKEKAGWEAKDEPRDSIKIIMRNNDRQKPEPHGMPPPRFMAFESGRDPENTKPPLIVTLPVNKSQFEKGNILEKYRVILDTAGLPSNFSIRKSENQPMGRGFRFQNRNGQQGNQTVLEFVLVDFDFGNPVRQIFSRMYGQIALSIFMTGMVILAFRFMYKSLKEQMEMAALKNDFISNMTHELKTPVATVSVALEALKNFSAIDNPQKTKEYLDISSLELNRLSLLIDKVLRINMFEAEKWTLDMQAVDLTALTDEVVQSQQLQADKIKAVISWQKPGQPIMVKGDKLHLMSVLYNLLDNALKYRSDKPFIKVELENNNGTVYWQVQDNGPGIAAEYTSKVFEKFFRVPHGDRHDVKGYGLGLSYVEEVVRKHGGKIQVRSEPGKGSTFTVTLPIN